MDLSLSSSTPPPHPHPHHQTTKYTTLPVPPRDSIDDLDLDLETSSDSDTTLASTSFLPKPKTTKPATNHPRSRARRTPAALTLTWLRWSVLVFLQAVVIFCLVRPRAHTGTRTGTAGKEWQSTETETGGDVSGLYRPTTHKYTLLTPDEEKFVPNMSSNDDRMRVRRNWDMLMPLGSGTVEIPDYKQHPMLGKPIIDDPIHSGAIFEASWTHALHCLYYTVDSYHQLVVNGTFGFDGIRNDFHAAHCFEYLRNQILCMADMTLEGSESLLDASGEGQAHMCRDRDEANAWIEERRVDDIQSIVGP